MVQRLNKFKAVLSKSGALAYNQDELAVFFDTIAKEGKAENEEIEFVILPSKQKAESTGKIKIAKHKISQVEFLSKKLNIDRNSTFLLLNSFGSLKK